MFLSPAAARRTSIGLSAEKSVQVAVTDQHRASWPIHQFDTGHWRGQGAAVQEDRFQIQRKVTFFLEAFEIFRNTQRVGVVRGRNCGGTAFRFQASRRHAVSVWVLRIQPLGSFSTVVLFRGWRPVKRDAKNLRVHIPPTQPHPMRHRAKPAMRPRPTYIYIYFYLNFTIDLTERRPLILFMARVGVSLTRKSPRVSSRARGAQSFSTAAPCSTSRGAPPRRPPAARARSPR